MNLNYIGSRFNKKRIINNLISKISQTSSSVLVQLIFPPLMIIFYGLENFGIWVFLSALPLIFSTFNINLFEASKNEMSIYHNQNKIKKVQEIFNNSKFFTLILFLILALAGIIFLKFFDYDLKILEEINKKDAKILIFCFFFSYYLTVIKGIFEIGIIFWGKLYIQVYIETFFDFFIKFSILVVGFFEGDLVTAAYIYLFLNIIKFLAYLFFFMKYKKYLSILSFKFINYKILKKILLISVPHFFENISNLIKSSFQIIILGLFFSSSVIGLISTLKTMFYYMPSRFWGIPIHISYYEIAKLFSKNQINTLKIFISNLIKLNLIISFVLFLIIFFFGLNFYNFWLNNSYEINRIFILILLFEVITFNFSTTFKLFNKSINDFFSISIFDFVINITILLLLFILFNHGVKYEIFFIINLSGSILICLFNYFIFFKSIKFYKKNI